MSRKTPQTAIFISSETAAHDAQDVFFRSSTVQGGQVLREGQTVTYELERGPGASGKRSISGSWKNRR